MAAKKTDKVSSLVVVDITELGRGLKTVFTGAAMVFGSLGCVEAAGDVTAALSGAKMPKASEVGKAPTDTPDAPDTPDVSAASAAPDAADKAAEESAADEIPPEEDLPWDEPGTASAQTPSKVTADDITKVIVAKIKQKRSNNAKIGALLKAYGAEKVSSLPAEKYEAFLTDISQL